MTSFLQQSADFIWGLPLLIFIFIGNIIFAYHSKFLPLLGFKHSLKLLVEKKEQNAKAEGQISHFESFCNAIAATVGLGNISGVAIAISMGGPGAIFWMWVAAFFGMNTKFFECAVAQMYRGKDYKGEIQGGAMYVIENALPKKYKILSTAFALCGLMGTLSLFQINQLAQYMDVYYGVEKIWSGIFFAILTAIILGGGLKTISKFSSLVVPVMSVSYFLVGIIILAINFQKIPATFILIFKNAFSSQSVFGGVAGYSFLHIMTTGLKRATFSNEAGIGTAPMAHSNSKTSEPISEGYVAMLGPFLDTIVICTITALVVLINFESGIPNNLSGIEISTTAFVRSLGILGRHFLGFTILLFAFSTMIGMANYNQKCWDYLFKGKFYLKDKIFNLIYSSTIVLGAVIPMVNVINLMDIAYALMTIPNMFATIYLAKKVQLALTKYNQKTGLNES